MRNLVYESVDLLPIRSSIRTLAIDYRDVRENAIGIYEALDGAPWHCKCALPHYANLRLESRIPGFQALKDPIVDLMSASELKYRVLFQSGSAHSQPWEDWRETDIVPVELPLRNGSEKSQRYECMVPDPDLA